MNIRRILLAVVPLLVCGAGAWHFFTGPAKVPAPRVEPEPVAAMPAASADPQHEFYGRVLDQAGVPVTEARVLVTPLTALPGRPAETSEHQKTSARGYFRFTYSPRDPDLGISLVKDGYEFRPLGMAHSYIERAADRPRPGVMPTEPVAIQLWKKQGAETLIHYIGQWLFPANARALRVNLFSGKAGRQEAGEAPEADLIVTVRREPLALPMGARGFAWRATIEVVEGGIVRAEPGSYPYLAPMAGYAPRLEFAQAALATTPGTDAAAATPASGTIATGAMPGAGMTLAGTAQPEAAWLEAIAGDFFVSLRGGKYHGRLTLRLTPLADRAAGENAANLESQVWLNPSGSRNLEIEYGEGKTIAPQQ